MARDNITRDVVSCQEIVMPSCSFHESSVSLHSIGPDERSVLVELARVVSILQ